MGADLKKVPNESWVSPTVMVFASSRKPVIGKRDAYAVLQYRGGHSWQLTL